jgi:5'-methylthioadenosine phosphorylase
MAHVTDYDVWHVSEETVTVDMVVRTLMKNVHIAQETIKKMVEKIDPSVHCDCENALQNALITHPEHIDPKKREQLDLLIGKYLD